MAPRTDYAPAPVGCQVASRPDVAHAGVDGEYRVVVRELVEHVCDVLGMDRHLVLDVARVRGDDAFQNLGVPAQHPIEEGAIRLLLHKGEQRADRLAHVAGHADLDRHAPPELGRIVIHLRYRAVGQEVVIGKVGAEQDQQVGLVDGLVAGAVAEQPAHADVVGVVVLDPLLAAERVADGRKQPAGELHHLVVGVAHSRAGEQRQRSPPC